MTKPGGEMKIKKIHTTLSSQQRKLSK